MEDPLNEQVSQQILRRGRLPGDIRPCGYRLLIWRALDGLVLWRPVVIAVLVGPDCPPVVTDCKPLLAPESQAVRYRVDRHKNAVAVPVRHRYRSGG